MTNLLTTIITVLVTNVTVTDNAKYEWHSIPCPQGMIGCLVMHAEQDAKPTVEATEKTETEVVTEKTILRVKSDADVVDIPKSEREVSRRVRVSKLKPAEWIAGEWQWHTSGMRFGLVPGSGVIFFTNKLTGTQQWAVGQSLVVSNSLQVTVGTNTEPSLVIRARDLSRDGWDILAEWASRRFHDRTNQTKPTK